MSSTISTVELKTIPPKTITNLKMEDKQHRLVRSSSIEKIKKFNNFICSHQYYLLPAILSWLKSSQSGLQYSTETTIYFFRSLFFSSFISKVFSLGYNSTGTWTIQMFFGNLQTAINSLISNFYKKFSKCFESTFLLTGVIYIACWLILAQLLVSIYLIYNALMPSGYLFLIGCMLTIKYLCYKTMFFTVTKNNMKLKYK